MDVEDIDPKLTELCNECTIQENKRGFFNTLLEDVFVNSRIREWTDDIWNQNLSDYDYLSALMKEEDIFKKLCGVFRVEEVYRKKCDVTASKITKQAEECSDPIKTLELFNQAIIRSSTKGLPAILKLRAISLLRNNNISLAVKDLQFALEILAEDEIETKKLSSNATKETNVSLSTEIQCHLSELLKTYKESSHDNKTDKIPSVARGTHTTLEGASVLIKMSEDIHQGRYAVAAEDISVGDTLVVEDPYVSCLKPSHFGSHCHHCFKRLTASMGCPDCCTVAFCCQECRIIAINSYHKYECKFMNLFIGSGMSIGCHSALRMVTQVGLDASLKLFENHLKPQAIYQNEKNATTVGKTSRIFNLCKHRHMRKPSDYLRRGIMAFFLLRCLQKTTFFSTSPQQKKTDDLLTSDEMSVLTILFFALQAIQFNAHEITEEAIGSYPRQDIALAIFATSSLFNHDCYPGVIRYFVGKTLIVRAIRPGNAGCSIVDNYGPRFERQSKDARLRALRSRYWFKCSCCACTEAWVSPPTSQVTLRCPTTGCDGKIKLITENEDQKCHTCKAAVSTAFVKNTLHVIKQCTQKYEEGIQLFKNAGNSVKAIEVLTSALTLFHGIACPPHAPTHSAEDTLRRCYTREANCE